MKIALIGSGSLALGLIYPWLRELPNADVALITRAFAGKEGAVDYRPMLRDQGYKLRTGEQSHDVTLEHELLEYDASDLAGCGSGPCVARLVASDVVIVSVGVGNLGTVGSLLASACRSQEGWSPEVVALENLHGASSHLVRLVRDRLGAEEELAAGLTPHAAIPDRSCARKVELDSLEVVVESFGEIVVERTLGHLLPQVAEAEVPQPRVLHVSSGAVQLAEMRKLWLVNGTHTALGFLCDRFGKHVLRHGLETEGVTELLSELHLEWVGTLSRVAAQREETDEMFKPIELTRFAGAMFERLAETPDMTVHEVLRELADLGAEGPSSPSSVEALAEVIAAEERLSVADLVSTLGRALVPPALPSMVRLLHKLDDRLAHQLREASCFADQEMPASGLMLSFGTGTTRRYFDRYLDN